ncbi:MAG: aldose 1-epimerase family protein [Actinomycetota bacterium]|nr:aldose 1-epimerase family protein [Actinomycetota bacterium]
MAARLPSGQQHEICHGEQRAVIVEVGGGLRVYENGGGAILDGYGAGERCDGGRGQPLMPWPNRIDGASYEFDGVGYELPVTEASTGTAIHGLVRWANWVACEHASDRVVMTYRLYPQPGWPGILELVLEYGLSDEGLSVTTTAANRGPAACPFGAGFHPYVGLGAGSVDKLSLQAPGRRYLEADEQGLPVASHAVTGTPLDFVRARRLGDCELDTCFTDLERDERGIARVAVAASDGPEVVLWMDASFQYLMLFTGDSLAADRRRRGLAIEPMSCPPNALRSRRGSGPARARSRLYGALGNRGGE